MRRSGDQDAGGALALVAVAGGLVVAALASRVGGGGGLSGIGGWLADRAGTLILGGAGVVAVVLCVVVARRVAIARTLRSRVRLALVPGDAFDPSVEGVQAFAAQLARTRRAVRGWWDAPASAIRIRIAPDPDGLMVWELEAPARAVPALRAACTIYADAQLTEPVKIPADERPTSDGVVRAELVLARPSSEPLADRGLDPDPLQAIAGALAGLRGDLDETATVMVDLRPVSPAARRRLRARMLRHARRHTTEQPSLREVFRGEHRPQQRGPVDLLERRTQSRALQGKLGTPQPLFEAQLLLQTRSASRERAQAVMQALLSGLDAFAGENHLTVSGTRFLGLWHLGSDVPWRRHRFDRRMRTCRFAPARRNVITAAEIAGLLKPPTARCQAPNVRRSGGLIAPSPPSLPDYAGQPDVIPLGHVAGPAGPRLAGVRVGETVFSYMAGRSRYGKTETAIGQFVHLARAGNGGLFLDPHADAIAEIKAFLTDREVRDRVVEIDLSDHEGRHGQPGWNLFAVHGRPAWQAADRVEAVVDALAAALGWDERNTRALNLATQAAQALTELALVLRGEVAPTIFQVPTLLSDEDWRAAVLPFLSAGTRQFFTDRFPRLPAEAITPVTNIIDRLRAARPVAALLGSPNSTFDARHAIDHGQIVLACPGSGGTRDRLVANLLVYEVLHATKTRIDTPPQDRRPFWIFLDELQTYDGPNLPALLEQSAKYGGRAFLFNQNPERLTDATLNAVTTNRSHLATTAVNAKAAGLLSREWGGEPAPATITQLARYTYLASVTIGDRTTKPFLVNGVRARELHHDAHHPDQVDQLDDAIDRNSHRQPVDEILAGLEQHDRRILRALRDHATRRSAAPAAKGDDEPASRPLAVPRVSGLGEERS